MRESTGRRFAPQDFKEDFMMRSSMIQAYDFDQDESAEVNHVLTSPGPSKYTANVSWRDELTIEVGNHQTVLASQQPVVVHNDARDISV